VYKVFIPTIKIKSTIALCRRRSMKNTKGIAMPKKRVNGIPYEELNTVKIVDNKALYLSTVETSQINIVENLNWRQKSYESFKKRLEQVSKDYTGGYDEDLVVIHDPMIVDVDNKDNDLEENRVLVNFAALIPLNHNMKRVH
jgi:hypothetical protein